MFADGRDVRGVLDLLDFRDVLDARNVRNRARSLKVLKVLAAGKSLAVRSSCTVYTKQVPVLCTKFDARRLKKKGVPLVDPREKCDTRVLDLSETGTVDPVAV